MISSLELARLCGVSQGTVDRALHDRPGVSATTKARILAIAAQHGYLPHPGMHELISGTTCLIGGIVPSLTTPFFMDLMQAAHTVCRAAGYRLLVEAVTDREEFLSTLGDFAARRFRGALVIPPEEDLQLPDTLTSALRIATFLSPCLGKNLTCCTPDEVQTGQAAVEYLTAQGHECILHLTYARQSHPIQARRLGYWQAMEAHGLTPYVCATADPRSFLPYIMEYQPTAIFCHNDWLALSVIRELSALRYAVPEDISILGVDNSSTFTALYPGISTMQYPYQQVAARAVDWILHGKSTIAIPPMTIVTGATV